MKLSAPPFALSLFLLGAIAVRSASADKPVPADMVLHNGVVFTAKADRKRAQAIAIARGRIAYVGTESGVQAFIGPKTQVIDLKGKMVAPGFHDSHVHPISSGMELAVCNLHDVPTAEKVLAAVREYAAANPDAKWIRGGGWALPLFPQANPSKTLLDEIVPDRPVFLDAEDGHSAWVNSVALKRAGVTAMTPDPKNGRIERDPKTGEPTGTLREDAMNLVSKFLPPHTPADRMQGLKRALQEANRFGITSMQDASVNEDNLKTYAALEKTGELTARITASLTASPAKGREQVARFEKLRRQYTAKRLRVTTVKIFADGVMEPKTAALLIPYLGGKPNDRGAANFSPQALNSLIAACDKAKFQVHVHAIGDRAIRMTLDAFEKARAANGVRDSRHHIAHLELIDPQDIPRFRKLNVVANFQPFWAYADPYIKELTLPILGPARSRWLYPIGSVEKTGAIVVFGSDWSVTTLNPILGIHVAVTRRGLEQGDGPAWIPQEVVSVDQALDAYTSHGAYVQFQEKETGSLEVGKAADVIVLDHDLFKIPGYKIGSTKVLLTLLEGKPVYRDPAYK